MNMICDNRLGSFTECEYMRGAHCSISYSLCTIQGIKGEVMFWRKITRPEIKKEDLDDILELCYNEKFDLFGFLENLDQDNLDDEMLIEGMQTIVDLGIQGKLIEEYTELVDVMLTNGRINAREV